MEDSKKMKETFDLSVDEINVALKKGVIHGDLTKIALVFISAYGRIKSQENNALSLGVRIIKDFSKDEKERKMLIRKTFPELNIVKALEK